MFGACVSCRKNQSQQSIYKYVSLYSVYICAQIYVYIYTNINIFIHVYIYIYTYRYSHLELWLYRSFKFWGVTWSWMFDSKPLCICQFGALQNKPKETRRWTYCFLNSLVFPVQIIKLRNHLWYHLKVSSFCLLGLEFPKKMIGDIPRILPAPFLLPTLS